MKVQPPSAARRLLPAALLLAVSHAFQPHRTVGASRRWAGGAGSSSPSSPSSPPPPLVRRRAESDELSWQEGLERVLNPFTSPSEKQIMLQNLVARREEVIADVQSAASSGSPQDLLPPDSELRKAAEGAAAVQRQIVEDILPSLLEEVPTLGSDLVSATPELIARAAEAVSWVVASRS